MSAEAAPAALRDLFRRLSGLLFSEETVQSALDLTAATAHQALAQTSGAGVTLIREGTRVTAAYSDEVTKRADALQYELDEGPCLSSWADGEVYLIDSMETETRWPRWAPRARALGMRSSVSVPLVVRDQRLGAVKAYSMEASAYDQDDAELLALFARQAAIFLANVLAYSDAERMNAALKSSLGNRHAVALALGVLMEREKLTEPGAFKLLRDRARDGNLHLAEVARQIAGSTEVGISSEPSPK